MRTSTLLVLAGALPAQTVAPSLTTSATGTAPTVTQVLDATGDGVHPLDKPEDLAVDALGNLYVCGFDSDNVFRVAPDGSVRQILDASGDGLGHVLDRPVGVAVDRAGNVFVVGLWSQNVFRVAPDGTVTQLLDAAGSGGHTLDWPFDVAVDAAGDAYVAGSAQGHVFRIAPDDTVETIDTPADWPMRLAVGRPGEVYITSFLYDAGFHVAPDGTATQLIGPAGDGQGNPFTIGYGVALGRAGEVFMGGTLSENVFRIGPHGDVTQVLDASGDGQGNPFGSCNGLYAPFEILVDRAGRAYVNGLNTDNVFRVDHDGTVTQALDATGDGTHPLDRPAGLALDHRAGALYVAVSYTDNVFRLDCPPPPRCPAAAPPRKIRRGRDRRRMTDDIQHRIRTALGDRYEVGEPVGVGGMATVYRARDLRHARDVAIKVLRPELAAALGADRFRREIHVAAQLQHPNVLPLHDSGEADGLLYYVMPLVEGRTLADRMRPEGLPLDEALRLGREIADGLASAHAHDVVHRDVKPGNVLLSEGHAVVADFGLASSHADVSVTQSGSSLGTPLYMSPEQAAGEPADARSDVYSLGCVLQELVTGAPPFSGKTALELARKHEREAPPPLRARRPDAPVALERLVARCIAKRPSERFADAGELADALAAVKVELQTGEVRQAGARKTRRVVAGAALLLAVLAYFLVRSVQEAEERRWIDEVALPRIEAACDERAYAEAYDLALQVEALAPDHPRLARLWSRFSGAVVLESEPSGAAVSRRPVDDDDAPWEPLGTTPVEVHLPHGFHRIRFEKAGHLTTEVAGHWYYLRGQPTRLARAGDVPDGMRLVPGGKATLNIPGMDHLVNELGSVLVDVHEVTNAQWAAFVDAGGYEDEALWTDPLVRDGVALGLAEARAHFVDRSGQTGPATWVAGDVPAGLEQHPVTGVSWFEARAYCRWAGRELPTLWHWNRAAETRLSAMVVPKSNYGGAGTLPVGASPGRTAYGLADMGGNAREWCRNETAAGERVILGGGWDDRPYMFNDFFAQDPWDRSRTNGLRTSIDFEPVDPVLLDPLDVPYRDFSRETPVSDEVFAVYRGLFDDDPLPLDAEVLLTEEGEDYRSERVAYDLPYGERTEAWFYVPTEGDGPFPTIVYFPGSNAIHVDSSEGLARPWVQWLVKQGYALIHPIYKGTYERGTELDSDYPDETTRYRDHVIWWGKDFRRAVDYVQSRPECDVERIGYLGTSWGGAMGPLMCAIEPRIKTAVLYVAGLLFQTCAPEVDVFHYVPRVTIPVLMLNGRYDHFFPVDTSQRPLFDLLGTPEPQKRYYLTEEGHSVPFEDLVRETLAWYEETL